MLKKLFTVLAVAGALGMSGLAQAQAPGEAGVYQTQTAAKKAKQAKKGAVAKKGKKAKKSKMSAKSAKSVKAKKSSAHKLH